MVVLHGRGGIALAKKLTVENWLSPDPIITSGLFKTTSVRDGTSRALMPEDWTNRLLSVRLAENVPTEIRDLFEVAQGAMVYGSLFYPLFTLGNEQLYRLAETAVRAKATLIGLSRKVRRGSYRNLLVALRDRNEVPEREYQMWDAIWELRNHSSHPKRQSIQLPHFAVKELRLIAQAINRLFSA